MRDWLIVGGPVEPIRAPSGAPRAYADLLARFGAGTFNDFVRLLPPKETQTYGERLGMEDDPVLAKHVVFADSDNGDALTWNGDAIYRFAPRSFEPKRVDLLDWLAKSAKVKRPFFVPRRERRRFRARFAGKARDFSKAIASLEDAELLARDSGPSWTSCKLHVPACDGIARVQHAAGFWQLAFDAKAKTKKSAFDAVLRAFGLEDAPLE